MSDETVVRGFLKEGTLGLLNRWRTAPPNMTSTVVTDICNRPLEGTEEPLYSIQLSDSNDFTQIEWDFIVVNDPGSPKFNTQLDQEGRDTLFGWANRNLLEEERAMETGLFPGQARKGLGRTSPNPAVGALIVRNGEIIASGYHKRAGSGHAEIEALAKIGGRGHKNDILYVTLEPCNHHGRTPPCTEAILSSGIKKLVVGMKDPNPKVCGGGCEFLAGKGVEVRTGVLESECRRINEAFLKFATTGRPFVVVKSALTMDGWTATVTGHSRWVTNEKSRGFVHRLRDRLDGVLVGVGTVLADDPMLTTRLKRGVGKDPVRIILDTDLRIPDEAKVLNSDSSAPTLIAVGADVSRRRVRAALVWLTDFRRHYASRRHSGHRLGRIFGGNQGLLISNRLIGAQK